MHNEVRRRNPMKSDLKTREKINNCLELINKSQQHWGALGSPLLCKGGMTSSEEEDDVIPRTQTPNAAEIY